MNIMKHYNIKPRIKIAIIVLLLFSLSFCKSKPNEPDNLDLLPNIYSETDSLEGVTLDLPSPEDPLPVSSFGEIWAYVVAGRESGLKKGLPVSDIGYFGAEIDTYGKLTDVPRRRNISFTGKVHLVVACSSRSLSHFVLAPGSSVRRELIADLLAAARDFNGLQIDFEYIPSRDGDTFLSFLKDLRAGLPNDKMFTIALPARIRKLNNDQYDYEKIKPLVDRVLVMAYDEHWSGSRPGSVASLQWCRQVAEYSLNTIGHEKLIMGLPFYGRAWGDYNPSRALIYSTTENLINENNVTEIRRENGIPVFEYDKNVSVKVYYEDAYSLSARMEMYKSMGVSSIGFWRLGQETPDVWDYIKLDR
uniref:Glycoside hydrolase, family 18 n=1 Tax=uncultured bacterium contig00030 TaxID=1181519 RepID=A0A806K052_9BACT|nr:glycoside hydrolase, family 18 [uncultured bacterium contig00030]